MLLDMFVYQADIRVNVIRFFENIVVDPLKDIISLSALHLPGVVDKA